MDLLFCNLLYFALFFYNLLQRRESWIMCSFLFAKTSRQIFEVLVHMIQLTSLHAANDIAVIAYQFCLLKRNFLCLVCDFILVGCSS